MSRMTSFRSDEAFWPIAQPSDFEIAERPSSLLGTVLAGPRRLMAGIARELETRRAMRALATLDDRMLHDIGIERDQIGYVARHGRSLPGRDHLGSNAVQSELARLW